MNLRCSADNPEEHFDHSSWNLQRNWHLISGFWVIFWTSKRTRKQLSTKVILCFPLWLPLGQSYEISDTEPVNCTPFHSPPVLQHVPRVHNHSSGRSPSTHGFIGHRSTGCQQEYEETTTVEQHTVFYPIKSNGALIKNTHVVVSLDKNRSFSCRCYRHRYHLYHRLFCRYGTHTLIKLCTSTSVLT